MNYLKNPLNKIKAYKNIIQKKINEMNNKINQSQLFNLVTESVVLLKSLEHLSEEIEYLK